MRTIAFIARNGDAVRQAIELGDIAHIDTASGGCFRGVGLLFSLGV